MNSYNCADLSGLYLLGIGTAVNNVKALELALTSCSKKNAKGCVAAGIVYGNHALDLMASASPFDRLMFLNKTEDYYKMSCDLKSSTGCKLYRHFLMNKKEYCEKRYINPRSCLNDSALPLF